MYVEAKEHREQFEIGIPKQLIMLNKFFAHALTIFTAFLTFLVALYTTILLGWLILCWPCGATESGTEWLFWPLAALLSLGVVYLFSRLPGKFGGGNLPLAIGTVLLTAAAFLLLS